MLPRLCTLCHLTTRMLFLSIILCILPVSPAHFRVTSPWLSTGHLLLNLYYARCSQDLYMSHGSSFAGRSYRKSTKAKVKVSIQLGVHIYDLFPSTSCPNSGLPTHGYQLYTYHWTYTMPCSTSTCIWVMASLQQQKAQESTKFY